MKKEKSVTINHRYLSDEGKVIVIYNCMISNSNPFGFTSQDIKDKELFDKNKSELTKAYSDFQKEVNALVEDMNQ